MINANELRIGNWVEANSPAMIVKTISKHSVELYMPGSEADNFDCYIETLSPIPLTPEILEKAGFDDLKPDTLIYEDGILYIHSGLGDHWSYGFQVKVEFVHQLQNIIFALTGQEINIKL